MSWRVIGAVVAGVGVFLASSAWGQGAKAPTEGTHSVIADPAFKSNAMVDAKGRKITVVNFEDALIEGAARAPDGFVLQSRQAGTFRTILDLRREFRLQMQSDAASGAVVVPLGP